MERGGSVALARSSSRRPTPTICADKIMKGVFTILPCQPQRYYKLRSEHFHSVRWKFLFCFGRKFCWAEKVKIWGRNLKRPLINISENFTFRQASTSDWTYGSSHGNRLIVYAKEIVLWWDEAKSCVKERNGNDERLLAEDLFVYLIYLWQSGGGDIEMVLVAFPRCFTLTKKRAFVNRDRSFLDYSKTFMQHIYLQKKV